MNRISAILAGLAIVCAGCSQSSESGSFAPVDASGWAYGDTLRLVIEPTGEDSTAEGRLAIAVRHTADYAYSNIWLEVSYPPADSLRPDTFNIRLADSYGNRYGKGLGLSYQYCDTTSRRVSLRTPAALSIRHIMRNDLLENIEQIGIVVIPD